MIAGMPADSPPFFSILPNVKLYPTFLIRLFTMRRSHHSMQAENIARISGCSRSPPSNLSMTSSQALTPPCGADPVEMRVRTYSALFLV
jgi:hypothetical protein